MKNENIKLSAGEKLAITSRTPDKMPLNPTAQGWTGSAIRAELGKAILLLVDELQDKLEEVYNTFAMVETITDVVSLDDETLSTGVYVSGDDIIFHSATHLVQIGIINGAFIFRTYVDDAWVEDSGVYEPSNPNIQEHIAIVDGNPHGVDKTDLGLGSVENYGVASQVEAVAGEVNNKYMTPLRTKEAIDAKASNYYTQEQIDAIISGVYKPSGSLSPEGIVSGLLIEANLGNVYNITGEFTSTANFKDGGGKVYAAGTNLAIVLVGENYMFDVLMGYDIDAQNVIYDGSNVKEEITNLKANKADRIINRVYYGSSYVAEPGYMVTESPTIGSVTTSATISTENLIFRNYVVLTKAITINLGRLFSFNASLQRTSGGANTTSTVTVKLCKFTGDPTIEVDRDKPALYTPIGSSLPYTADFDTAIYLHKTLAALGTFALEVGDKLCFRVYVNPSATSDHVISNTVDPILLTIPEQGFDYSSDDVVNDSNVDGASVTDALNELNQDIIAKGDAFDNAGTYMDLKVGLAYNLEGAEPYLLDEAFDLRVTAGEDTEVTTGLAKVKTLEAVVTQDGDGIITNITTKPTLLMASNDNMLEFLETYKNTSYGVTVEIVDAGVVRIYGTATGDIALENHGLSKYLGISNFYDASAKLYAEVIAGSIPGAVDIYYNSAIDSGIIDGIVGTNAYITLDGNTKYLNQLEISLDIPNATEIDVTLRFWTKHASNPNQDFVRPNTLEKTLYTSELTEDDWYQQNVINYDAKTFTKYWEKNVYDGDEAWELYIFADGVYKHFLPITNELVELASTTLVAMGRLGVVGIGEVFDGGMAWAQGSLDGINGIIVGTTEDLATFKTTLSTSNITIWIKYLTPTITSLETITNEIVYPAFNYGLEFGLLGNKLGVEYSSDFQKQITTNLENIIELKATKAETIETSVTIDTTDWVADGVTAPYKAVKTVSGVLASDNPIIAFDLTGIADTAWNAHRTEFAKIGLASTTDDDEITFYASAIPTEDITVIVKVVR